MRILRVIATVDAKAGGPMEGLRQTSRFHSQWGHQTVVVSCDQDQSPKTAEDTFELEPLGPAKYGWAYSPKLRNWLEINLSSFDLVIIHGLWLYPSWAVAKVYQQRRAQGKACPPLFVFSHGMLDPWFQSWKRRPIKTLRNVLYWKAFEALTIKIADGILFTSSEEQRLACIPFKPYQPAKEVVLPYGTSTPPEPSPELKEAFKASVPEIKDRSYLLFLSRLHEKKGVDLLLEAYAQLKQKNTDLPALVIAGPGLESPYGTSLKQIVEASKLKEDVHFTGMLKGSAKWGAYHGCDAFVLPSHQENFGIAVAEALACSKAVLISNKVNIWKEIAEAKVGYVGDDTKEGVQLMLQEWLDTPDEIKKSMSVKALELFSRQYHVEASAQALLDLVPSS